MLTFFRPSFKSGVFVIKDKDNGKLVKRMLKASDNGKRLEFLDEKFVQETYPQWILDDATYQERKNAIKKAKKEKKVVRM